MPFSSLHAERAAMDAPGLGGAAQMFPPWAQRGGLQREREKARKPLVVSGLGKALGDMTQPVQVLCGLVFGKKTPHGVAGRRAGAPRAAQGAGAGVGRAR